VTFFHLNVYTRQETGEHTESLGVDLEGGGGGGGVAETVLGDAVDESVIAARTDRVDAQNGAVRDRQHRVSVVPVTGGDAPAARPPEEHVRRWIAGRQADERRDAVVDDLLVARSLGDARRVCNARTRTGGGHVMLA